MLFLLEEAPVLPEDRLTRSNIVASAELDNRIDWEAAVEAFYNVMYEVDQFPGAVYWMDEPKVVIPIFRIGDKIRVGKLEVERAHKAF